MTFVFLFDLLVLHNASRRCHRCHLKAIKDLPLNEEGIKSQKLDSPYKAILLAAFIISSKYIEQYKSRRIHYNIQLSKEREGATRREKEREAELRIKSEVKLNQGYNSSNAFIELINHKEFWLCIVYHKLLLYITYYYIINYILLNYCIMYY